MASIVKRNKSYAVVYWYKNVDGERKQKWETYNSNETAQKRKLELENPVMFWNEKMLSITVNDLLDEYIELHGQLHWSYSTYKSRTRLLNNYVRPFLGKALLTQTDKHLLSRFFCKLKTDPSICASEITIFEIYKLLHSIFEQSMYWGYFKDNIVKHINLKQPHYTQRHPLTPEQIATVINHCLDISNYKMALIVYIAFSCSMRKGEILGLCWSDIDFKNSTISISKELLRVSKKSIAAIGLKSIIAEFPSFQETSKSVLVLKSPKTRSSVRTVYMTASLVQMLEFWRHKQKQYKNKYSHDLIFTQKNGRPLCPKKCNEDFKSILRDLHLPTTVFHSLRYSSTAYKLILSGGNIKAVQGDTGHAQPNMVLSVYAQINEQDRINLAKQMEDDFCKQIN